MLDINGVKAQARRELAEQDHKVAVAALKGKLKLLSDAQKVVENIARDIADLEASLADGSFPQ